MLMAYKIFIICSINYKKKEGYLITIYMNINTKELWSNWIVPPYSSYISRISESAFSVEKFVFNQHYSTLILYINLLIPLQITTL